MMRQKRQKLQRNWRRKVHKSFKLAVLGLGCWLIYKAANQKTRAISDNSLTDFSGFSVGQIQDTLTGEFMKVGGLTGLQVNGGASASLEILAFLKGFEKFRAMPYFATDAEKAKGIKTVGYGHVILPLENFDNGVDVQTANMLFVNDVNIASEAVINAVNVPLTQGQFDALVSFVFNVGGGAFRKSTLLKYLNAGDYDNAANQFLRWVYQGKVVLNGLYKRRTAEMQIFKFGNYVTSFGA